MSESLNDMLAEALEAHSIPCRREGNCVFVRDLGLVFHTDAKVTKVYSDSIMVLTRFETEAPALEGRVLRNELAGLGSDEKSATVNGFAKFLLGPFHVLLSALGGHSCAHGSEEWREYFASNGKKWRVCDSALVTQGLDDPASVPFAPVQQEITQALLREASSQAHWVEVFFGFLNGQRAASEVLLDGMPWPAGLELLERWDFVPGPGYQSGRYFFVALKSDQ